MVGEKRQCYFCVFRRSFTTSLCLERMALTVEEPRRRLLGERRAAPQTGQVHQKVLSSPTVPKPSSVSVDGALIIHEHYGLTEERLRRQQANMTFKRSFVEYFVDTGTHLLRDNDIWLKQRSHGDKGWSWSLKAGVQSYEAHNLLLYEESTGNADAILAALRNFCQRRDKQDILKLLSNAPSNASLLTLFPCLFVAFSTFRFTLQHPSFPTAKGLKYWIDIMEINDDYICVFTIERPQEILSLENSANRLREVLFFCGLDTSRAALTLFLGNWRSARARKGGHLPSSERET